MNWIPKLVSLETAKQVTSSEKKRKGFFELGPSIAPQSKPGDW